MNFAATALSYIPAGGYKKSANPPEARREILQL